MAAPSSETSGLLKAKAPVPWYSLSKVSYAGKLVLSVGAFMCCSGGMMLVNKQVTLVFGTPLTIVGIQMAFTVAVLGTCFFWTLRFGSKRDVFRWVVVIPQLYAIMLASSMLALQFSSMGFVTAARNIAPAISLALESAFGEKIQTNQWTWLCLLYIFGGVCLYTSADMGRGTSIIGLGFVTLNMVSAVIERILQRRLIAVEPVDLSKTSMLLLNNAFAIVPVGICIPFVPSSIDRTVETSVYGAWKDASTVDYVLFALSCVIGVAIGWTALNAQAYLTATSMLVVTNMNKVIVVAIGMAFMGEVSSWQAVLGLSIALTGGLWYALIQRDIAAKRRKAEVAAAERAASQKRART